MVQNYKETEKESLHLFRFVFHIFPFLLFYVRNALGFCPKLFCTKREK